MKTLALVISTILAGSSVLSAGELQNLRSANAEQKRQINSLEKEVDRLFSLLDKEMRENGKPSLNQIAKSKTSPTGTGSTYTVVKGDTLSKISRQHRITINSLMVQNRLSSSSVIQIGQKLVIPGGSIAKPKKNEADQLPPLPQIPKATIVMMPESKPTVSKGGYTVAKGDTFYAICRKLKVSFSELSEANPNVKPASLKIGQHLNVPGSINKQAIAKAEKKPTPAPQKVQQVAIKKPSEARTNLPKETPKQIETVSTPSVEEMKPIVLNSAMNLQQLADKHNTSVGALNALNGWSFLPNIKLAKGSEVFIPTQ